ncbi:MULTISPECIES: hypothetical protein [Herbaspirillum]|uniref:hypothetical protein n=1 Tax=Herbaspirillum TaxID=963 RepID=UPI000315E597|nr:MULTISPECIES: hypothetical protein [Herbaspirillum]MCP1576207.1 hypothetical protein [Herbaspirillum rubrisubalbicans]
MALFFIICAQKEAIGKIDYSAADGMARSEAGREKQGFSSFTAGVSVSLMRKMPK